MSCQRVKFNLPAEVRQPTTVVVLCQTVKILLPAEFLQPQKVVLPSMHPTTVVLPNMQPTKVLLPSMPPPGTDAELNTQLSFVPDDVRDILTEPLKVELSEQPQGETAEMCLPPLRTIRVSLPRTTGEQWDSSFDDESEPLMGKSRSLCIPPGLDPPGGTPSHGSILHKTGNCQPCAWYWKSGGCQKGKACTRCHSCPDGELKARRKTKYTMMKLGLVTPKAGIAAKSNGSAETNPSFCLEPLRVSVPQAEVSHSALHPRSEDEPVIAFSSMNDCGGGGGCFMSSGRPIVLGLGGGRGLEQEDVALVADKANEGGRSTAAGTKSSHRGNINVCSGSDHGTSSGSESWTSRSSMATATANRMLPTHVFD